jgi:hypothetical protein
VCILRFEFTKHNRIVDVRPYPHAIPGDICFVIFNLNRFCRAMQGSSYRYNKETVHFASLISILNTIHCNHNTGLMFKGYCLTLYIIVVLHTTAQSFVWYVSYLYCIVYTQLSERCSADANSSIGCMKQNMFVYRYVLTIQFPFGMRAVICRYPAMGGG